MAYVGGKRPMRVDGTSWSSALVTLRILWAALLASTLIYGGLILSGMMQRAEEVDPSLAMVFYFVAASSVLMSFVLPSVLWRKNEPPTGVEVREELDPTASSMFRDAAPTRKMLADPDAARKKLVARGTPPFIVGMAMAEVPAILALVAWMAAGISLPIALVMVGVSAAVMATRFPRTSQWKAKGEELFGGAWPEDG